MVDAFVRGQRIATPVMNPQTVIATLATGNPGRAYELLYDYVQENGGAFADATDEEAFDAIRLVARLEGISVEPATGVMFAGMFKLVQRGVIKPDEVVVLNCSGHTLPVEREILGEQWQKQVELQRSQTVQLPEDKLLSALDHIESSIKRILIIEDTLELQCVVRNHVQLKAFGNVTMLDCLKACMRLKPTRIVVGEVRGAEALTLLKSWNTGHPGGVATVHANDAQAGLKRLEALIAEATAAPSQTLIAEAVDLVVFIDEEARLAAGRKVREVMAVRGFDHTTMTYQVDYL